MNEIMDEGMGARLTALEAKADAIFESVEKTRKIMLWTGIVTIAVIVVPLLLLPLFIPAFLATQGLGSISL